MYYLQSRYYNPEWGRFINADELLGEVGTLLDHNIFVYCANDPVNNEDHTGYSHHIDTGGAGGFGGLLPLRIPVRVNPATPIRNVKVPTSMKNTRLTNNTGGKVPPQLLRGQSSEKMVLKEQGIIKNTEKLFNSIPDSLKNGRITEVKDVKYIYKDKQFRDYINSGKPIDLIVSPQSRVSKPLQDAIRNSGGSIRVRQFNGEYTIYK